MAESKLSSLIIDVRPGERLAMSGRVTVELLHKSGQLARLRVTAPRDVQIVKDSSHKEETAVPSMAT
jgi:sRNA-binding carbon storage regulator CsrA